MIGHPESRVAVSVRNLVVRASFNQQLDDFQVPHTSGVVQRRIRYTHGTVHKCAMVNEILACCGVSRRGSHVQGTNTSIRIILLTDDQIDIRARFE